MLNIFAIIILLGVSAVLSVVVVQICFVMYCTYSLIVYCELSVPDMIKIGPERAARMVSEKLNEISILLGYRNEQLKRQMKEAGIIEDADDYGYGKTTYEFRTVKIPEMEEMETVRIEFIDFRFANLRAKSEKIKQVFEAKELLKKALAEHSKMSKRFMKT